MRFLRRLFRRPVRDREWNWELGRDGGSLHLEPLPMVSRDELPGGKVVLSFAGGPDVVLQDDDPLGLEFRRLADEIWKRDKVRAI